MGAGIFGYNGSGASTIQNCIIASSTQGDAVHSSAGVPFPFSCCDLYGNAGGDWVGSFADQLGVNGNVSLDPLFCDPQTWCFFLQQDSPCAPYSPQNPGCDLTGAWPVGCGPSPVEPTTWGALKARFR
jgi:hypothetical protein